ncbi:glycosyltransferase family 4 protein [Tindallia californiensis]|uniref:UDP-GlcNAc:undecaprenyl-phosphate GlcNAc-1-phosphate transferase n=1 Tax=Tindallia californiensis TaxID=159292 RepID=A0A1H3LHI7_9FIRM|nr:MraY family glycosyltransferase [Tindallia californiensis]SDY63629.1 UDP-GlcNAc:undecaprenyl-phosphate GlcNAc-1-phosphate transferase [Tindallia californiensis]
MVQQMVLALMLSGAISYIATPIALKISHRIGAIDIPKDNRRMHKDPIPRLGGLAIYVGFVISSLLLLPFSSEQVALLTGATLMMALGMVDDSKTLSAKIKLSGQILAALIVMYGGVRIEFITNFLAPSKNIIALGWLSFPVTLFWIVGITNTVNLIDGLDGLAAGVSVIASLSLAAVAYLNGMPEVTVILLILAGASLGFLPHNSHPARIFMGDTGSLFIGFVLAVISVEGVLKSATTIAVAIPVMALGVPIVDTTCAIIRRFLNKRPIMEADKGHLHHRLLEQGYSHRQTVWILYGMSLFLGAGAVYISDAERIPSIIVLLIVIATVSTALVRIGLLRKTS